MEADVEGLIGAGRYERSGERSTWRNGYRERTLAQSAFHELRQADVALDFSCIPILRRKGFAFKCRRPVRN
jgi:hypothetical protein